jgi:hypothetical protein
VAVALSSDGAGTSGFSPFALPTQSTAVNGKVYTPAVGQLNTAVVDFGIVRVGDSVGARNVNVGNLAQATALNDTLSASLSGLSGAFAAGSAVSGVAAGGNANITVSLGTATAGAFAQDGSVRFLSQNPDMADASGGPDGAVHVQALVNNLANADFDLFSSLGTLTQNGSDYFLDLGPIQLGASVLRSLKLDNDVPAPGDDLRFDFDLSGADDFGYTGWLGQTLAPGQSTGSLDIAYQASQLGLFEDTVLVAGNSINASDPAGRAQTRRLFISARVVGNQVPEPGTLVLLVAAMLGAARVRRRRQH